VGCHIGNALDSYAKGAQFESQLRKSVIVTEVSRCTPQCIQNNSGIVPRLGPDSFLSNSFLFIIHPIIRWFMVLLSCSWDDHTENLFRMKYFRFSYSEGNHFESRLGSFFWKCFVVLLSFTAKMQLKERIRMLSLLLCSSTFMPGNDYSDINWRNFKKKHIALKDERRNH
jgi:hypothetical protein